METQHIFKPGDTAHTIWVEEVTLKQSLWPSTPIEFWYLLVDKIGKLEDGIQLLYPYPVRVTLIPEFEQNDEVEADNSHNFDTVNLRTGFFVAKYQDEYVIRNDQEGFSYWPYCRKITKPEKTRTELMEELIEKQKEYTDFLADCVTRAALHYSIRQIEVSEQEVEKGNQLRKEISSLQEQLKQKY